MIAEHNVGEEVLRNALSKRETKRKDLAKEIADLDSQIENLKRGIDYYVRTHSEAETQLPMESHVSVEASRGDSDFWDVRHAEGSFSKQISDAILHILLEERPMHRKKILEKVEAKGSPIGRNRPDSHPVLILKQRPPFCNRRAERERDMDFGR